MGLLPPERQQPLRGPPVRPRIGLLPMRSVLNRICNRPGAIRGATYSALFIGRRNIPAHSLGLHFDNYRHICHYE